jgi:siroheme synthase (precorrin-2 oxidase/ferrochelatase)
MKLIQKILTETTNVRFILEEIDNRDESQLQEDQNIHEVKTKNHFQLENYSSINSIHNLIKVIHIPTFNSKESARILKHLDQHNQIIKASVEELQTYKIL